MLEKFKYTYCESSGTTSPNMTLFLQKNVHISYNMSCQDYGSDTTAIVFANHLFFILNGDYRSELPEAYFKDGCNGLLSAFIENIEKANKSSEHFYVTRQQVDFFNLKKCFLEFFTEADIDRLKDAQDQIQIKEQT